MKSSVSEAFTRAPSLLAPYLLAFYLISSSISLWLNRAFGLPWANFLDEFVLVAFLGLLTVAILLEGRLPLTPAYGFLLLFAILGLLSSLGSVVSVRIGVLGFLQTIKPAVIFAALFSIPLDRTRGERLLRTVDRLMVGLVVIAAAYLILFDLALNSNPIIGIRQDWTPRLGIDPSRSFFEHPGALANVMVLATLYHFTHWLREPRSAGRALLSIAAVSMVFSTTRMKAIFALPFLLALSFFLVTNLKRRFGLKDLWKIGLGFVAAAAAIIVLAYLFRGLWIPRLAVALPGISSSLPIGRVLESAGLADGEQFADSPPSVRRALFDAGLDITLQRGGLGAGFGMFGSPASVKFHYSPLYHEYGISSLRGATPDYSSFVTDQWWSWFMGEVGLWGALAYLLFLGHLAWGAYASMWALWDRLAAFQGLAGMAIGGIVYGIGVGYAENFLSGPPLTYLIFGSLGLVYALWRSLSGPDEIPKKFQIQALG